MKSFFWPVADVTCCGYFEEGVLKSQDLVKQAARQVTLPGGEANARVLRRDGWVQHMVVCNKTTMANLPCWTHDRKENATKEAFCLY